MLDRDEHTYLPTHGPPITEPRPYVEALIEHRMERERQVLDVLAGGPTTVADVVAVLYADVRPELHEPAARSVRAHLIALEDDGRVREDGDRWSLA